jgi:hypothetical protein
MPTKRTPINRPLRPKITPEALEASRAMQLLERRCTCKGEDDDGECAACRQWAEQHSILHSELRLQPWQWPAYEHPVDADVGSQADHPDPGGPAARYRLLKQAAKGRT